jgi:hypothetical protein
MSRGGTSVGEPSIRRYRDSSSSESRCWADIKSGTSWAEFCDLATSRASDPRANQCWGKRCERFPSCQPRASASAPTQQAKATYRPIQVTGMPSLAQRCAVETGWQRNLAMAGQPFRASFSFCFTIPQHPLADFVRRGTKRRRTLGLVLDGLPHAFRRYVVIAT